MQTRTRVMGWTMLAAALLAGMAHGNHIQVTNVSWHAVKAG